MAAVTKNRNFLMVDFCFILSQKEHKFNYSYMEMRSLTCILFFFCEILLSADYANWAYFTVEG
jgi:hypothetical protein